MKTATLAAALVETAKNRNKLAKAKENIAIFRGRNGRPESSDENRLAIYDAELPQIDAKLRERLKTSLIKPAPDFPNCCFEFSQDIFDLEIRKAKGNNIEVHFRWENGGEKYAGKVNFLPSHTGGYAMVHIRAKQSGHEYMSRPLFNYPKDYRIEYLEFVFNRAFKNEEVEWDESVQSAVLDDIIRRYG